MKKLFNKKIAGFSLIEALIAALVVGVGILGLAKLQGEMFLGSADSRMRTHALNLAQDKIEELRSFANKDTYTNITHGTNASTETIMEGANANFTRSWTVGNCLNAVRCKTIAVTVSWTDSKNQVQQVQLTSYIAEADPAKSGMVMATMNNSTSSASSSSSSGSSGSSSSSSASSSSDSSSSSSSSSASSSSSSSGGSSSSSSSSSPTIGGNSITGNGGKEDCIASISVTGTGGTASCSVNNAIDKYTCTVTLNPGVTKLTNAKFSAGISGNSSCGNIQACIGNQPISTPTFTIDGFFIWPQVKADTHC